MNKSIAVISTVALLGLLGGCASEKKPEAAPAAYDDRCKFPGTQVLAPGWVCDEPVPGWDVTAVGSYEKTAAGFDFQKQMAMTAARTALAQQFKVQVANMVKQYAGTTGAAGSETVDRVNQSTTKQITDQTLVGSKVIKSVEGPDGKLWVLMGLDAKAVEELTKNVVKTSMNNDQALWQQFQGQKAQDELAAEIARQRLSGK